MDGGIAPIAELSDVADAYNVMTYWTKCMALR